MNGAVAERVCHPCLAPRCGHGTEAHVRTPELDTAGEVVVYCAHCRRHEIRLPRWFRGARREVPSRSRPHALPFRAV